MTTTQPTAGQELTAALRSYYGLGACQPRYRYLDRPYTRDLFADMVSFIVTAAQYPDTYGEPNRESVAAGLGAAVAYEEGVLAGKLDGMNAWQFAGLLGELTDAAAVPARASA